MHIRPAQEEAPAGFGFDHRCPNIFGDHHNVFCPLVTFARHALLDGDHFVLRTVSVQHWGGGGLGDDGGGFLHYRRRRRRRLGPLKLPVATLSSPHTVVVPTLAELALLVRVRVVAAVEEADVYVVQAEGLEVHAPEDEVGVAEELCQVVLGVPAQPSEGVRGVTGPRAYGHHPNCNQTPPLSEVVC